MAMTKSLSLRLLQLCGCLSPCGLYRITGFASVAFISSTQILTLVASSLCLCAPCRPYVLSILDMSFRVSRCIRLKFLPKLSRTLSNMYWKSTPLASCPAMAVLSESCNRK